VISVHLWVYVLTCGKSTRGRMYDYAPNSYIGVMATVTINPNPAGGSTALGTEAARHHPLHVVGTALRAVRVFAETTFRVVVLGDDGLGGR
jgi:hypothetical protein